MPLRLCLNLDVGLLLLKALDPSSDYKVVERLLLVDISPSNTFTWTKTLNTTFEWTKQGSNGSNDEMALHAFAAKLVIAPVRATARRTQPSLPPSPPHPPPPTDVAGGRAPD